MKSILLFENAKFWRARKTLLVLTAVVLALIGMVIYNVKMDEAYWKGQWDEVLVEKAMITIENKNLESQIDGLKRTLEENPDSVEALEELEKLYQFYRRQYLYNYQQELIMMHINRGNALPEDRLDLWIERDQHLLAGLESGLTFLDAVPSIVRQRLLANEYIVQENITLLSSPYQMTATNFLYQLTSFPWMLIILIGIALLTIDIFSGEIEGGAYKVLYSQPFGRGKIYLVKYLVRFANSFFVITGIIALAFAAVALFNGLGDTSYPTSFFSESYQTLRILDAFAGDTYTFIPWSAYILRTLPLYALLCCFIAVLIGTASLLLDSTANVVNVLFSALVLDFLSRTLFASESIFYMFWPLTVTSLNSVLEGSYSLSAAGYLILLGALTVVLLLASLIVLNKRDLTGGVN